MAVMAGKDGQVSVGAAKVGYVDSFSIAINNGTAEISQLGDDWKMFISTARDWSGSFSGTLDYADAQQKKLVDAILNGTLTELEADFKVSATLTLHGKIVLTSVSISGSHADKIAVDFSFQGSGALSSGALA